MPRVPILALTATATDRVIDDVKRILRAPRAAHQEQLQPDQPLLQRAAQTAGQIGRGARHRGLDQGQPPARVRHRLLLRLPRMRGPAAALRSVGVPAAPYHARLTPKTRESNYQRWFRGRTRVVCATIAFGLGINKLDVRFVVHHTLSKSMESYYQESGRAGRDGKRSDCALFSRQRTFPSSRRVCFI